MNEEKILYAITEQGQTLLNWFSKLNDALKLESYASSWKRGWLNGIKKYHERGSENAPENREGTWFHQENANGSQI